jgi:hypothetical protein
MKAWIGMHPLTQSLNRETDWAIWPLNSTLQLFHCLEFFIAAFPDSQHSLLPHQGRLFPSQEEDRLRNRPHSMFWSFTPRYLVLHHRPSETGSLQRQTDSSTFQVTSTPFAFNLSSL